MSEEKVMLGVPEEVRLIVVNSIKDKIKDHLKTAVILGKYVGDLRWVLTAFEDIYEDEIPLVEGILLSKKEESDMKGALDTINTYHHLPKNDSSGSSVAKSSPKKYTSELVNKSGINLVTGKVLTNKELKRDRESSQRQSANKVKSRTKVSKYVGVSWVEDSKNWRARICHKGKKIEIGRYLDEVSAAKAYDKFKLKTAGCDLSRLNFPRDIK